MTGRLEEQLRDEFAARAVNPPLPADLADVVIARAHRVRRHRLVAMVCSVVLALAGSTFVYLQTGAETDQEILADAAAELGVFSVLGTNGEIITGSGELHYTGLGIAESAVEMHGGWIVAGFLDEDAATRKVRYVGYDGNTVDLAGGAEVRILPNERGDAVVIETVEDGGNQGSVFRFTADSKAIPMGTFRVPEDTEIGGMTGHIVWMRYRAFEEAPPTILRWSSFHGLYEPEPAGELPAWARIITGLEGDRALVQVPGDRAGELCLMTVRVDDDYLYENDQWCYSDLDLQDLVVGPDGNQVVGYVQPAEPTDDDPGEWVFLDFVDDRIHLRSTGFHDIDTRPFFTYQDIVFHSPDGDWYELSGEQLDIPPLDGQPIPIRHVP